MDTILYYIYRKLDNYNGRWELMASIYVPVIFNQLS